MDVWTKYTRSAITGFIPLIRGNFLHHWGIRLTYRLATSCASYWNWILAIHTASTFFSQRWLSYTLSILISMPHLRCHRLAA